MTIIPAAISAICALIYGVWYCHRGISAIRTLLKTAATGFLALVAVIAGGPVLLLLALALSALGDLALSRQGERSFLIGLCSFALAHLAYIGLFAGLAAGWPALTPALILVAYAILTEVWLAPHTMQMRGPVRMYVLLITGMGLAALTLPGPLVWAVVGAGAFVVSDTLLAIGLFRLSPGSPWQAPCARTLWALYYGAQAVMTWAILG